MSNRSSLKKAATTSNTVASSSAAPKDNKDLAAVSADGEKNYEANAERRPSSSWSVWNAKRESETGFVDQSQRSWWRKASFASMGLTGKDQIGEESVHSVDQKIIANNQTTAPSLRENNDTTDQTSSSRTPWLFWNKKDETKEALRNKSPPLTSNELIVGDTYGAILFKTRSEEETSTDAGALNSNEAEGHNFNLLVPDFHSLPKASIIKSIYSQITKLGMLWDMNKTNAPKPSSLYRRDPQISLNKLSDGKTKPVKVLIIGVHGFFPTKMIRPLIGEPTGTSMKFILEAETAVSRWFQKHDTHAEISKIALEKEGKVLDRVEFFFDVLKRWINEINSADFVYFVAHSQGCPVTIMLLAKLIEAGIIDIDNITTSEGSPISINSTEKKKIISILAMAGINNGPFYGADQTFFVKAYSAIESDSLKELFEFQNFHSVLSQKFIQSLRICIASNVKIAFVGSINDQLVPLYSSTCQFAHHPNIFKATFVDKDSRTPAFITRIVSIANHLINLGYDDHSIIKEISASLAGTLTGGGHSKIYNEGQVYELGIRFALETTDLPTEVPVIYKGYEVDQLGSNPYHLPWCMRGLLYETGVHLGKEEIDMLFSEFEQWDPETKQLKNVKYRLNGLKSKL
ncbi:unnamed protein product [Kluyveromyces dobzhanskii CBS 2104]|uniref:WGS project CCBQ000000000 data, contig 00105 n=1 Tax=Kluyveromyces dobzhanskii CBS 2104 TaxID=1427455 RepID=A0A0A8L1E6_9SACH|nr:unnamed protein product [Kluyveromyces dobzhanskii CBS 2104]